MKKLSKWLLIALSAVICIIFFVACTATPSNTPSGEIKDTFTVTFYQNYDGSPAETTVSVKSGEAVEPPANPTRQGYNFEGWFTNRRGTGRAYDFSSAVTDNLELFAIWTQSYAELTLHLGYNVNGAEALDVMRVEIGTKLNASTIATPTRQGDDAEKFEFTKWYTSASYTTEYNFDTEVTGNFALYAKWEQVKADITFNYADKDVGATEAIVRVPTEEDITSYMIAPEREGYDFVSWVNKENEAFVATAGVTADTTLYATWQIKTYSVTFDWNFEGAPEDKVISVNHGGNVTLPEDSEIPTNKNNIFVGWTTDAEGNNKFDLNTTVTSDMTIYAEWMEKVPGSGGGDDDEIIINFYLNEGDTEAYFTITNPTIGSRINAPAEPTKDKYIFAGWAQGSASGTEWIFASNRVQGSTNLYAVWLKGYNFEAEYTYVSGKYSAGWSGDGVSESPTTFIGSNSMYTNGDAMHVSGNYFIYAMLYNGASLEFYINAEEAVSNARLVLRLAPDGFDYALDDSTYQVIVNGDRLEYGILSLPIGAYQSDDINEQIKPPFFNYLLDIPVSLQKGENLIQLKTNNEFGHGGTYVASTPYVDCITIYTTTTLSWVNRMVTDELGTHATVAPSNVEKTMEDISYEVIYHGDFRNTSDTYGADDMPPRA